MYMYIDWVIQHILIYMYALVLEETEKCTYPSRYSTRTMVIWGGFMALSVHRQIKTYALIQWSIKGDYLPRHIPTDLYRT